MRKAALVLLPVMALTIAILVLNLREADEYEFGSEAPPGPGNNVPADDFAFHRILPELKFVHACAGCGECVHPFEIVANRRLMSMRDHDGWYKAFWAADEEYFYADPIHMLADWGKNRTAEAPRGSWLIRIRAGSATHRSAPSHECGQIPREILLRYELVPAEDPIEETFHSGDGPLKIVQSFSWFVTNPGRPLALGWRLSGTPAVDVAACPCARP